MICEQCGEEYKAAYFERCPMCKASPSSPCSASECQCPPCVKYREYLAWKKRDDSKKGSLEEENRHLKDMLATLSKIHAKDMRRLSDMIDLRQGALRHISEIIEEKNAASQDLLCGSTAYKSVRRWASDFLHNIQSTDAKRSV